MPPASSPEGCMEQDRRSCSFREDPFSGTEPGPRQGRDQVGALGSPACSRESAVVSACWLAPRHLTALAPTPPWLLPWGGYNSETVRITPRHLAPHASGCSASQLGSARSGAVKAMYRHRLGLKAGAEFIAGAKQAVQAASAHRLELPKGFQGRVSKDRVREGGCDHLVDLLLTDWW